MKVTLMELTDLVQFERNPKKHPKKQIDHIKKSIEEFGWTNPILATKAEKMIVAGHARYQAAKELNLGKVPVILLDMPYEKAVAYVIADNRLAELAETDSEKLAELLGELQALPDFDIETVGFTLDDLPSELHGGDDDFNTDGALDNIKEPITQPGDVILLGRHRLMCGDSTDAEDVKKLMDGKNADIILTDPPYGIAVVQGNQVGGGDPTKFGKIGGGNIVPSSTYEKIVGDETTETAQDFYNLITTMGFKNVIMWGGNYFTDFLPPSPCWIIWDKENTGNFADVEMAWTSFEKGAKLYKWLWNGLSRKGDRKSELISRVHPTQKPVGLHVNILKDFTDINNIIGDFFSGGGTILIAAEQTNRICYGMELSEKYCDVIVHRWEEFTKKKAVRL